MGPVRERFLRAFQRRQELVEFVGEGFGPGPGCEGWRQSGTGGHGDGMGGVAAGPGRLGFGLLAGTVPNMEDVHPAQLLGHSRKLGLVCSLHLLRPSPETLNPRSGPRAATQS